MKQPHGLVAPFAALAFSLVFRTAPADEARAPTRAEAEVMQVTQDACQAFLKADVAGAEALLLPGFTLVNSRAVVQSRDEVLAELRAHDPVYSEFRNHSMNAHVFDDAAVVQGITTVKGRSGDQTFDVNVRFTDTLIREKGKWRLIVSHVTRIPG
ncbi:MAG TPA: nuclear transport factor 2 family protein [Steroidobacteraceae bacterium]|nr:nuclear transport factor 2 family protein [Steroidobacteraceae bacterium]